jgi:hypothetical protein
MRTTDPVKASGLTDPAKNAADFLTRVVPWPGGSAPSYVNLHWTMPNPRNAKEVIWSGKATTSVDEFLRLTKWALKNANIKDIYFCLSLQAHTGKNARGEPTVLRKKEQALALKAIWLDVDIKTPPKGYTSLDEAVIAVTEFVKVVGLPPPSALVMSGGGLHVYWINNKPLTPDEWRPYAEGLKSAAIQHGLRCDAGVTIDCARVLRVPDTFNYKTDPPKPVKLLGLRPTDYDFATELALLPKLAPTATSRPPKLNLIGFPASPPKVFLQNGVESLSEGIEPKEMPPLDWAPMVKECAYFRDALKTGGKEHSQPLWHLTVLAATFLEKGEKLAHRLGNKHAGYTPESTKAMWDRKVRDRQKNKSLGWPLCKTINESGSTACATCPHLAKDKSPLNFGLPTATPDLDSIFGQVKDGKINPVVALMKLRDQGANIETLCAAMNKNYAVVKYGNEILVANIIGNDVSFMDEQNFHRMFANLEFFDLKTITHNLRVMKERIERIGSDIISMPTEDFHKIFTDLVVVIKKPIKVSRCWFNWKGRRHYSGRGVVFEPGGPLEIPKDMLNLWRGFGIVPKHGDWSLIRNHILNVVCSGQKEHSDYLIKWMAYAVQHPNEPIGVAVALRGAQGAGKGVVARTFGKFFGKHFAHIANGDQLTGRFNASLGTSCAVFLDEALWAGDKKGEGVLKALITEPMLQLEAKFRDPIMVENRLRIIVASNNDWIAPVGIGDRRWFILDVANTYAGTKHQQYFAPLYAQVENGGPAAMFHYLLAMDLRGFDVRAVPHTAAKAQQQAHSLNGTEAWLYHVLQEGSIGYKNWERVGLTVSTDDAYGCYEDFSKRQHAWRPEMKSVWSKKMRTALGQCVADTKQKTGSERVRMFQLAPLSDCRRQFATHVGAPNIEWEPENEPKLNPRVADIQHAAAAVGEPIAPDKLHDAHVLEMEEPDNEPKKQPKNEPEGALREAIDQGATDLALVRSRT